MIDLETLGRGPGCVVPQVAVVPFNLNGSPLEDGDEVRFTFNCKIHIGDQLAQGYTVDLATLSWWMQQKKEVRVDVFSGGYTLQQFQGGFNTYIRDVVAKHKTYRIWASAPKLDFGCLHSLLAPPGGEYPILYSAERDLRTMRELVKSLYPAFKFPKGFNPHDAVEDCKRQIIDAQACYTVLKVNEAATTSENVHGDVRTDNTEGTNNSFKRDNGLTSEALAGRAERILRSSKQEGFSRSSGRSYRSFIRPAGRLPRSWSPRPTRATIRRGSSK